MSAGLRHNRLDAAGDLHWPGDFIYSGVGILPDNTDDTDFPEMLFCG